MSRTVDHGPGPVRRVSVVVASEHALVADSVRAALSARELAVSVVGWPRGETSEVGLARDRLEVAPDVGLVLSDLDRCERIDAARVLVLRLEVPWLVLTSAPPGPVWGAVLDAGASTVLPSATSLDDLVAVITRLGRGEGTGVLAPAERAELIAAWRRAEADRLEVVAGLEALTARELEVLRELHAGERVSAIATRFETTEATVRSQVKAVLRKLGAGSQLGAAATYERLRAP